MLEVRSGPSLGDEPGMGMEKKKEKKKAASFSHADVITAAFTPDGSSDPIHSFFFSSPFFLPQVAATETATLTCSLEENEKKKKCISCCLLVSESGLARVWMNKM